MTECDTSDKWLRGFHTFESNESYSRCRCGQKTFLECATMFGFTEDNLSVEKMEVTEDGAIRTLFKRKDK